MVEVKSHTYGSLETVKFARQREEYHRNLDLILEMGYENEDFVHHFAAFTGHQTLLRNLTLYELYKRTLGVAGHIAEIGVYKGAGSLLFAKLVQIYEPDSLTMVHGFDNFGGTKAVGENPLQVQGGNIENEQRLRRLILLQNLDCMLKVHALDVETDLPAFFEKHPHLRFKLVFLDSGTYEVTSAAIKAFWPRITPGGIMVFDQFNNEVAPGETRAVCELLPNEKIEVINPSWMPSAYICKGGS